MKMRRMILMFDNSIEMRVWSNSSSESIHLRILWFRIDDRENDSIRDRVDSRVVIRNSIVIQLINDFEYQCVDFDECLIRIECVFLIKSHFDKI
jgi:hypothetical protein